MDIDSNRKISSVQTKHVESEVSQGTKYCSTTGGTQPGSNPFDYFKMSSVKKIASDVVDHQKGVESVRTNIASCLDAAAKAQTKNGFATIDCSEQLKSFGVSSHFDSVGLHHTSTF